MPSEIDVLADKLISIFGVGETEQNWEKIEGLLKSFTEIVGKSSSDEVVTATKKSKEVFIGAISSERTRLLFTGLDSLQKIATKLGHHYEALQEPFLHQLFRLCERTSKLISDRAKSTVMAILSACPGPLKFVVGKLAELLASPNKMLRQAIAEAMATVLKHGNKDHFIEFEDSFIKITQQSLQDAAENVRTAGKILFNVFQALFPLSVSKFASNLPSAILKSLNQRPAGSLTNSSQPSLKASIAVAKPRIGESQKSGPQRVIAKTNSLPITNNDPLKKPARVDHVFSSQKTVGSRMVRSASVPAAPLASGGLEVDSSAKAPSLMAKSSSHAQIPTVPITATESKSILKESLLTGKLPSIEMDAKSTVVSFVVGVKSPEWDKRLKAFSDFEESMTHPKVQEFILSSRSTVSRLFEILLGALLDVHFKVVTEVLKYASRLLSVVPAIRHPEVLSFCSLACLRIFSILSNVQFKAKQNVLDAAQEFLVHIETWIGDKNVFTEILSSACLRQDIPAYAKSRLAIMNRLDAAIQSTGAGELRNGTSIVRRLGTAINDVDQLVSDAACNVIMSLQAALPDEDLAAHLNAEARASLVKHLERRSTNKSSLPKTPLSPITEKTEFTSSRFASPMKGVEVEGEFVIVDEEITLKIKNKSAPDTPRSKLRQVLHVDFHTPRDMDLSIESSSDEDAVIGNDCMQVDELAPKADKVVVCPPRGVSVEGLQIMN